MSEPIFIDKLKLVATVSPQFRQVLDFLTKLHGVKDRQTCILLCRAEMPKIGDSISQVFGDIDFVRGMKSIPIASDAAVMKSLDVFLRALEEGVNEAWRKIKESNL